LAVLSKRILHAEKTGSSLSFIEDEDGSRLEENIGFENPTTFFSDFEQDA
jgi:hypothetical protein